MKFYRIGNQLFDFETLGSSRIEVDGSNIVIGWRECKLATAAEAQKAFDRIAAILGAEDLCAEPAGDAQWKMRFGTRYWGVHKCGDVVNFVWFGEDEYDHEKFVSATVFRTREEAYSAAKLKERPTAEERWKPEYGEPYWTVVDGDVIEYTWDGDQGDDIDREQFDAGLVFRTQKEAEAALAKLMGPPPEATPEAPPEPPTTTPATPPTTTNAHGRLPASVKLIEGAE